MVPIWLGEQFSISPALDFRSAADIASELAIGIVPKYYLNTNKLAPWVGIRGGAIFYNPATTNDINVATSTDILLGGAFGGEYFFAPQFSVGVEVQGNFTFSDENSYRFGNPGKTVFNTATAVMVSVYF